MAEQELNSKVKELIWTMEHEVSIFLPSRQTWFTESPPYTPNSPPQPNPSEPRYYVSKEAEENSKDLAYVHPSRRSLLAGSKMNTEGPVSRQEEMYERKQITSHERISQIITQQERRDLKIPIHYGIREFVMSQESQKTQIPVYDTKPRWICDGGPLITLEQGQISSYREKQIWMDGGIREVSERQERQERSQVPVYGAKPVWMYDDGLLHMAGERQERLQIPVYGPKPAWMEDNHRSRRSSVAQNGWRRGEYHERWMGNRRRAGDYRRRSSSHEREVKTASEERVRRERELDILWQEDEAQWAQHIDTEEHRKIKHDREKEMSHRTRGTSKDKYI